MRDGAAIYPVFIIRPISSAREECFDPFSNLIETYLQRLRQKIDHSREFEFAKKRR